MSPYTPEHLRYRSDENKRHYAEVKRLASIVPTEHKDDEGQPKKDGPFSHLREPIAAHQYASHMLGAAGRDPSKKADADQASKHAWQQSAGLEKGKPDKSPWTIYSHAFDVKKKDLGKANIKSSALHELHHPRTATQTREAIVHLVDHKDTHTAGEQQALEERVRRAAKKHGISLAATKSPEAYKKTLERKARMAQKALDAITDMETKKKAISHATLGGDAAPSTNPTGGIRKASAQQIEAERERTMGPAGRYPGFKFSEGNQQLMDKYDDLMRVAKAAAAVEGEDEEKGYALGEAPPATRSGTSLYIRPQDRPTMPKKQKERKIDISTAPQFAGMPQGAEKSVEVEKAMKAASMPRIPRALMNDTYRSATAVLTRNHSAIAKDVSALHTGPLTDEGIKELQEEEYNRTKRMPVYKSCEGCGRTFMVKSMNDPCPTCSVNKSHYCSKCHQHLVKSGNGSVTCPLCG